MNRLTLPIALIALVLAGASLFQSRSQAPVPVAAPAAVPAPTPAAELPRSREDIALSFAPLVRETAPAVVNIYARIVREGRASPFAGDPFFEGFFRGLSRPRPQVQNSLGSGVILSPDGIVVSNYHVVGQATDIRVVLSDRREFTATVLLGDEEADLAILKLEGAEDLPFLPLRDSDEVEVGELVMAIGNPFGVGQTVSTGIVSGLARSGAVAGNARGYFIQTDAAINPGNSGGALVDIAGRLIGINTSILTRSGGSNGIGFAIPADLVAAFMEQAGAGATAFDRPWAGMVGQPVDGDLAAGLGLALPEGIVISDLHPESPFAEAGFKVGDIIREVDGQPVNSPSEMIFRMSVAGLNQEAQVTRVRDGVPETIGVKMIAAPDVPAAEEMRLPARTVLPDLVLARCNPAVIARLGLPLRCEGVAVTDPGAYGARAGLRAGDVILAVNGVEVSRPAEIAAILSDPGRGVRIDLLRRGEPLSLRFRV